MGNKQMTNLLEIVAKELAVQELKQLNNLISDNQTSKILMALGYRTNIPGLSKAKSDLIRDIMKEIAKSDNFANEIDRKIDSFLKNAFCGTYSTNEKNEVLKKLDSIIKCMIIRELIYNLESHEQMMLDNILLMDIFYL